jgi:hypothetical protein
LLNHLLKMILHNTMNKRYSYTPIIIAVILLSSYSQGHYVLAQNSPLEEQTNNASNDEINKIQNQEPTETRDGGEYSGFEETGVQTKGIPDEGAESTPEAPISGVGARDPNEENVAPFNVTNATGRSFNQSDTAIANTTTLQTNNNNSNSNNQAEENSSNPILDTLQKLNPLK